MSIDVENSITSFFVVIFSLSLGSGYKSVVKPLADIIRLISVKTALQAQNINDL